MKLDIQLFASTNKTTHYNLSQYISSDKPTYLVDYNDDMSAIDTGIYNAKTQADLGVTNAGIAQSTAENAQTTANTAVTNASSAQTDANTGLSRIGTMANLLTTEKGSVVGAINEVVGDIEDVESQVNQNTSDINKFNFTTFNNYNGSSANVTTSGCTITNGTVSVASNSDGSICKVYGTLYLAKTNQLAKIYIANSGITPSENIVVGPIGLEIPQSGSIYGSSTSLVLNTNGTIEITSYGTPAGNNANLLMIPFVIFVKNFGDTQ